MGTEGTHLYGDRAPHNLQYVVLVASANLTQERVLTGTSNQITVTDNGAGSTVVLSTPQDIHTGATPTFAGITLTAAANISLTNTVAAGESLIDCHIIQSDDVALTGTLRGAYITASNGDEVATGTIRGVEIKARAGYPGETGANVNVLEGFSISSDAKTYDITTHRGGEIILDGGAGTSTLAVCLRLANNFQADRATESRALELYADSFNYDYGIYAAGSDKHYFSGKVGVGTATPLSDLHLLNIEDSANVTILKLEGKRPTPTNEDTLYIDYSLNNSTPASFEYARTTITAEDITATEEQGSILFEVARNGALETVLKLSATEIVLNEAGADRDLRIETSGNANMLFVDGGNDRVGIGTSTPNQPLTIEGTMSLKEQAAANADTAAYGQLWIKNDSPNALCFTDDAGNDAFYVGDKGLGLGTTNPTPSTAGRRVIHVLDATDGSEIMLEGPSGLIMGFKSIYTSGYFGTRSNHDLRIQTYNADRAMVTKAGLFGIGLTSGIAAKLHVDQASTTAAIPVLTLDQADVSEEMIEFVSTIGVGNALEAIGGKTLTTTHFIKVTLPGTLTRYIPCGTIA